MNHRDLVSVRYLTDGPLLSLWRDLTVKIRHLTVIGTSTLWQEGNSAEVRADVLVYYYEPDPDAGFRRQLVLRFERSGAGKRWVLRSQSLRPLLSGLDIDASLL